MNRGAMLISPLMGPIMGIGLGLAVNDVSLYRKALLNYGVATLVALLTSTLYFLTTPLGDAHSEILARTSPNVYDVLIAFFGGLAGTLATASTNKGNVIPGAAIATALMPPLCTAGYGLATLRFNYFGGAFYLYIINTVFIALATFVMARILKYPRRTYESKADNRRSYVFGWTVVILTLLPSIYFGYDMVVKSRFMDRADRFIENEAVFANDYLLKRNIDAAARKITLVYGGRKIEDEEIDALRAKRSQYGLDSVDIIVNQGFSYLGSDDKKKIEDNPNIRMAISSHNRRADSLQQLIDSLQQWPAQSEQIYRELKSLQPALRSLVIQPMSKVTDSSSFNKMMVIVELPGKANVAERERIRKWLGTRLNNDYLELVFR
jgi:uncharacterized hydrophobic protein (TIGR00271 family)